MELAATRARQTCSHEFGALHFRFFVSLAPNTHWSKRSTAEYISRLKMAVVSVRLSVVSLVAFVLSLTATCSRAADDASILISEIGRASNESLLWGPYKPNLYFGVRPRIPKSLAAGLLWAKVDNFEDVQHRKFGPF